MQCSAQHQAVRHHTKSTDGAARYAGCSGPMRPCVTARRRRQGSVGQVREYTGPAMPETLTHSTHTTHTAQPVYLYPWVDIPAFCLLVTAPSAQHTTRARQTQQTHTGHNPPLPAVDPGQEWRGATPQAPKPGVAGDHPPPKANPSEEWRGAVAKALNQGRRGTNQQSQQQTPARNGGELHPRPTQTHTPQHTNKHAAHHKQTQSTMHPKPTPAITPLPQADPSQEWRGTAPSAPSQEWRGTTHHHHQRTPVGNGGELPQGPQTGMAGDHPPPPPSADPSQEWTETPPRALSQNLRRTSRQHH